MSASYFANGKMVQLDSKADTDVVVTPDDVKGPEKLARLLQQALRENAEERRQWQPRVMFFWDLTVTAGGTYRLEHRFGGRVNYYPARWVPDSTGTRVGLEIVADSTTDDVLVLLSAADGVVTVKVEAAA